jgi:hypothetical protein
MLFLCIKKILKMFSSARFAAEQQLILYRRNMLFLSAGGTENEESGL